MLDTRLREARRKAKLSQAQLAKKAGIKPGVVAEVERDPTRVPAFDKVVRLANALGVHPLWLCPVPGAKWDDTRKAG